jgi:cytoplasmic iron level regulating protein YaaA (DUF328/UPF0246 family)
MLILIHSSKAMRTVAEATTTLRQPELIEQASKLAHYIATLSTDELMKAMHISLKLAEITQRQARSWTTSKNALRPAIDTFLGDIYSGLQVQAWTKLDREYADAHLRILSGLYGVLRPLDGIYPYRLEMGYRLSKPQFHNLVKYWGKRIADALPVEHVIVNLAAAEYSAAVLPYFASSQIISPSFLTLNEATMQPQFVVVHTKIARGAYANWLVTQRIENPEHLAAFSDLGYRYEPELSTPATPVFVCKNFKGLGLSVRLTKAS